MDLPWDAKQWVCQVYLIHTMYSRWSNHITLYTCTLSVDCVCGWSEHANTWGIWSSASYWTAETMDGPLELVWPQGKHQGQTPPCVIMYSQYSVHVLLIQVNLVDIILIAAMGPPGGGRNPITSRFLRHFNTFTINDFNDDTMKLIFSRIMDWHIGKNFPVEMKVIGPQVIIYIHRCVHVSYLQCICVA